MSTNNQKPSAKTRKRPTKEDMERGYYSIADHFWLGVGDVWWAICHPHKTISRNIGKITLLVVGLSTFGAIGYLVFDEPDPIIIIRVETSREDPGNILKVSGDQVLRSVGRWVKGIGADTADSTNAEDFRNGNDPNERE